MPSKVYAPLAKYSVSARYEPLGLSERISPRVTPRTNAAQVQRRRPVIKAKYEREEVPLECIPEGLQMVVNAMHDMDITKWPKTDVSVKL